MKKVLVIVASLMLFISCSCPEVRVDGLTAVLQPNQIVEEMYSHHVTVKERIAHPGGCGSVVVGLNQLNTYILTAGHCTFDNDTGPLPGVFVSNTMSGPMHFAKVLDRSWQHDLALIKTRVLGNISPVKIAKYAPQVGDEVWVIGCPMNRDKVVSKGIVSAKTFPNMQLGKAFLIDAEVTYGNSGGGVYNIQGELVGILIETRGRGHFAAAVHLDIIKKMLKENNL